ncbi:MAG: DUF4864 domain-containing protein [Rhizobiaceae bacterium]
MRLLSVLAIIFGLTCLSFAGEAEVKAAQSSVDAQLRAFQAGDHKLAYSYAAPNIQRIFPTVEAFMGMVNNGYMPVAKPKSFAFGKVEELAAGAIVQQVLIVGPDGKDYEAVYTLERQMDGSFKITGVSLRAANTVST